MNRPILSLAKALLAPLFALVLSVPALAESAPVLAMTAQAPSQQSSLDYRTAQVVYLLNGELAEPLEQVFTPEFLADVPPAQITGLAAQFSAGYGRAVAVESINARSATQAEFVIRMERALAKGILVLDPSQENRIIGLRFTSFQPIGDSPQKIKADLARLPGKVSAYYAPLDGGTPILSVNPDAQLALGSTFKLYVLAALAEDITQGKRRWDDVVALEETSFPSGITQDWPEGSQLTLQSLANLMISISDNTATDQLIRVLGRERVERMVADSGHARAARNAPFLTTREMFMLKGGNPDRLKTYQKAKPAVRRQILAGMQGEERNLDQIESAFAGGPVALDVEWFASPRDLVALFNHMGTFADDTTYSVMAINPSVPDAVAEEWGYIGYKGGSEPGVLNLTWLLVDPDGKPFILTLGWNNPEAKIDEDQLEVLAQRIIALPR